VKRATVPAVAPGASRARAWIVGLAVVAALVLPEAAGASPSFQIPATADQLILVSSPGYHPANYLATLRAYRRVSASSPWRLVFGPWQAETGYSGLRDSRHEGDGSTPTGVFGIGATFYGTRPDPGGLHFAYHRLRCGDWWDSDQYTRRYNRFVHVRCGVTPRFASESNSEGLWTETLAYPYFAVIRFNVDPTIRGRGAPGSAIFFHSWVSGPTAGCVALPQTQLLTVLRWLKPADDPVIEIGTKREVNSSPTP
jgi:L,D-peptidoglycan transpeptidase YkuD (ErfK/YbiS/YcfS/YnhG family)